MIPSLSLQELRREDARAWASKSLLGFSVGATEQHGPHLPVGTDTLVVDYVARAAATAASEEIPVVLAPTCCFQNYLA